MALNILYVNTCLKILSSTFLNPYLMKIFITLKMKFDKKNYINIHFLLEVERSPF
jgi:hypothetical protein